MAVFSLFFTPKKTVAFRRVSLTPSANAVAFASFPPDRKSMTQIITQQIAPTITPVPTVQVTLSEENKQGELLREINDYRSSFGLSSVNTDENTCAFAKIRAEEVSHSFNHDGFTKRINDHSLPYPSYHLVTENIAMNSDSTQVVPNWIASSGHAENMRANTPFVCVQNFGEFYAYEGWAP